MSDFELNTDDFYTDEEVRDHLREDKEEQERLEAEREAFFDEDDPMFDDDEGECDECEDDYTQDALIDQYDLSEDEFEGEDVNYLEDMGEND